MVRVSEVGEYTASYVFYDKCEHVFISNSRLPSQIEMSSKSKCHVPDVLGSYANYDKCECILMHDWDTPVSYDEYEHCTGMSPMV